MKPKDISQAKNPDLRASVAAMQRAAKLARQTAIATGTSLVIVKDGELRRIAAEELKSEAETKDATTP